MIIPSIFRALRLVRTVYAGRFCIPVLPKHTLTFTDRGDVASVKIICIMIIGYLRVSTGKQHLANQQDEIRRFAESRKLVVDHWVTEVVSGKKSERDRKLGGLLRRLKKNDTLIVTEISRLSRTLTDIMAIMGKCLERGINLYTTKEGYSFDNTINSKVLLSDSSRRSSAILFRCGRARHWRCGVPRGWSWDAVTEVIPN